MTFTIGIDGYNLALSTGTGIATYARTLASTVANLGWQSLGLFDVDVGEDAALQEILFFDRLQRPPAPKRSLFRRLRDKRAAIPRLAEIPRGTVDLRPMLERIPDFNRIATGRALFQAAFRHFRKTGGFATLRIENPPDIMHWTCPIPLMMEGAKNIYTVHDLIPLRMPYMTLDDKRLHHALIAACVATGDHLCSVSNVTANELFDMFPASIGKVTTTYQTCDIPSSADMLSERESLALVTRLGIIPDNYFLFYGALEPKKNVARLIEAHARLDSKTPLVIVTGKSWNSDVESSLIERMHNGAGNLIVIEFLPRNILHALIRHARAVTFPSLHEGFGLPVLEAMRLGVPVLTGNSGGVIEVAGDGGLLVDPYDVVAIRTGLQRLDADPTFRRDLANRGQRQVAKFSPESYRDTMLATYSKLLTQK